MSSGFLQTLGVISSLAEEAVIDRDDGGGDTNADECSSANVMPYTYPGIDAIIAKPYPRLLVGGKNTAAEIKSRWANNWRSEHEVKTTITNAKNARPAVRAFIAWVTDAAQSEFDACYSVLLSYLQNVTAYSREIDEMFLVPFAIDFLWNNLSATQKANLFNELTSIWTNTSIYNTTTVDAIENHRMEAPLHTHFLLMIVFAGFNPFFQDKKDAYASSSSPKFSDWFFETYLPNQNYWIPSKKHPQGIYYAEARGRYLYVMQIVFREIWGQDAFNTCLEDMAETYEIYCRLANFSVTRFGGDISTMSGDYYAKLQCLLAAVAYDNPYLYSVYSQLQYEGSFGYIARIFEICQADSALEPNSAMDDYPKVHMMYAPLGPAFIAKNTHEFSKQDNGGQYLYRFNVGGDRATGHDQSHHGESELWYNGCLYGDNSRYKDFATAAWWNYIQTSLPKSGCFRFNNPNDQFITEFGNIVGDRHGGQRSVYSQISSNRVYRKEDMQRYGTYIGGKAYGDDVILCGDITKAYQPLTVSEYYTGAVQIATGDPTYPLVVFEMKRVITKQPTYQKSVPYHLGSSPSITSIGNNITKVKSRAATSTKSPYQTGQMIAFAYLDNYYTTAVRTGHGAYYNNSRDYYQLPSHDTFPDLSYKLFIEPDQVQECNMLWGVMVNNIGEADPPNMQVVDQGGAVFAKFPGYGALWYNKTLRKDKLYALFSHDGGKLAVYGLAQGTYTVSGLPDQVVDEAGSMFLNPGAGQIEIMKVA